MKSKAPPKPNPSERPTRIIERPEDFVMPVDFDLRNEQDRASRYADLHAIADRMGPIGLGIWKRLGDSIIETIGEGK